MWNRLSEDEWQLAINELKLPLFYHSDYLKCIATVYELEISYLSFQLKNQTTALIAVLSDTKKNIVLPEGFSYTPFYIVRDINERLYVDVIISLIKILKKEYKKINFKFEIRITDIRPFSWENFLINVRYTHIKQDNLPPERRVLRSLGKDYNNDYNFKFEELNYANLKLNLDTLRTLNFSKTKITLHQKLLESWADRGYLKAFNLYRNNALIHSSLVLTDFDHSKAYIILLNKVGNEFKNAHSVLYQKIIEFGRENKLKTIDFCGANFKSISEFKSRFNTELKMYFVVSFDPFQAKIKSNYKFLVSKFQRFKLK